MEKLTLIIKHKEIIDPDLVFIHGINDPYFWSHHGHNEEDKERLRGLCRMLPDVELKERAFGLESLNDEEKLAYSVFYGKTPPMISCIQPDNEYLVNDGRHRLAMCQEEGIKLTLNVSYAIEFEIEKNEHNKNNISKMGFLKSFLFNNQNMHIESHNDQYKLIAIINNERCDSMLERIIEDNRVAQGQSGNGELFNIFLYSDELYNDLIKNMKDNNIYQEIYISEHGFIGEVER